MRVQRIFVAIQDRSAMGRGVLLGAAEFAQGRTDWVFQTLTYADLQLGRDSSPRVAEAVIGVIRPEIARLWTGPRRRLVENVSRRADIPGAANVTCDDEAIAALAADYLLQKPVEHLAFMGPADSGRRREVFVEAVQRAGRSVQCLAATSDERTTAAALARLPKPCGLFAFNDELATWLIRVAERHGMTVPQDLAVVGVDNDPIPNALTPVSITSIDPDFHRVGFEAARVLERILQGDDPPAEPIRIPPKGIIERHSSDFPREADALAVQAARLIRTRACRGLTVEQLSELLPTTYWTLNRRFQAAFGRSLQEEITRVRLHEARRLLRTTRLPVAEVAQRVGYGNPKHFSTVFRKHVGMPPAAYRQAGDAEGPAHEAATAPDRRRA